MLMCIDSVLAFGSTKPVDRSMVDLQNAWELSLNGMAIRCQDGSHFKIVALQFLGCALDAGESNASR